MNIPPQLKKLARIAKSAKQDGLKYVKFTNQKAVATDSFRLVEIEYASGEKAVLPDEVLNIGDATLWRDSVDGYKNFPQYEKILPDVSKEHTAIPLNVKYLADIASALAGLEKYDHAMLYVPTKPGLPLVIKAGNKGMALLMPLNK